MVAYSTYSDQELTALMRQGDRLAYTEIYYRYWPLLFRHARKMLRDDDEATDVVQDIFMVFWSKASDLVFSVSLSSYLYAATRNKIIDLINRNKVKVNYLAGLKAFYEKGEFITDHALRGRELMLRIEQEVARLPKKMRYIFELSRKEHLSHKEIALATQTSESNVKKQIHNAIKILRLKFHLSLLIGIASVLELVNKIF